MVQLNAADRLRAHTFPAVDDPVENLKGLLKELHLTSTVTREDFHGTQAAVAEVPNHISQLQSRLAKELNEVRSENLTYRGQDYVAFSTKAVEEFPKQGRLSGLVAVVLEPSRNGTTIRVMDWRAFRQLQRS